MSNQSLWDQHNVTDHIRNILNSLPIDQAYNSGRPFLTTYQIAIALEQQHPQIAAALAQATGGEGHGPYGLTTYIARWLPDRINNRGVTDIEMRFLAPDNLTSIVLDNNGTPMTTTTNQAGYNSTMFRSIAP
ncbi:hypothetical protein [Rosistilla oblonga]|uniref:hypothetical protein n=1 Tax=Rosistilla oblonga TaxID=2527990 RepID=UPI003A97E66B